MSRVNKNELLLLVMIDTIAMFQRHQPKIKIPKASEGSAHQTNAQFPHVEHPSNFSHNRQATGREICIAHTFVRRPVLELRAKNDPRSTLNVPTSPLLDDFPVLALLESPRVVLGFSKLPLEFCGVHPELRTETRFGDESIDNLRLEV